MGGTYDPVTGQIVWAFHVPLEEQLVHYAAHPPSALAELRAAPIPLPDHSFDGHGEPVNVAFELGCKCGSHEFTAVGWREDDVRMEPPISLTCEGCDAEYVVFDASKHGHDGAQGMGGDYRPEGEQTDIVWDDLDAPYGVIVRYEYPSDHLGGDGGYEPPLEELFSWITILAKREDGTFSTLFEFECA